MANLIGDDGDNNLVGDSENDSIFGGGGSDTLNGGDGVDTIDGGAGLDDLLSFAGAAGGVTVTLVGTTPPPQTASVVTFEEANAPLLSGFGGAEDATIVEDPAGGGNMVARVVKSGTAELWAGTTVGFGGNKQAAEAIGRAKVIGQAELLEGDQRVEGLRGARRVDRKHGSTMPCVMQKFKG